MSPFLSSPRSGITVSPQPENSHSLQAIYFQHNAHSFAQRRQPIPRSFNHLRTLLPLTTSLFSTSVSASAPQTLHLPLSLFLSATCSLFALSKKVNSFAIKQIQPLFAKHPGGGLRDSSILPVRSVPAPLRQLRGLCVSALSFVFRSFSPSLLSVLSVPVPAPTRSGWQIPSCRFRAFAANSPCIFRISRLNLKGLCALRS